MTGHASASPARLRAARGGPLNGVVRAPGDKSISHRSLLFGALASGTTTVEGLLESDDVARTAAAMAAFGARVELQGRTVAHRRPWRLQGAVRRGRLRQRRHGVRLIMGAAAGFALHVTFTGDQSLRGRPMGRVLEPLAKMGATWMGREGDRLPLTLKGGNLRGIDYRLPMASAQVKSAVLLAGLHAEA